MTQTQPAAPASVPLDRISLRERERGFVVGGVDSGKSTLMDVLGAEFVRRYHARGGRRLILDSKPRYRAQWTVHGHPASRRYRKWSHGRAIPGSVVVDDPRDLKLAWQTGARTVIAQCESDAEIARLVATAKAFLDDSRAARPQLLQVDETCDFFHQNGAPRGGSDTIAKSARAGRERGTAGCYGSQRTKGIPTVLLSEMSRLYALRIDYRLDAKRLPEMGAPIGPDYVDQVGPHEFFYWWKGDKAHPQAYRTLYGPYTLALGR